MSSSAATPYSSNSNPFADPSTDNPFESQASFPSTGTAQPSISDREAALNAREAELLRRENEVASAGVLIKNWPKCEHRTRSSELVCFRAARERLWERRVV